ncbi:MAG: hypothetical protein BWX66_02135 [Deltaproteobacteria bacterium ADurb.Bin058]|nr:MAG: hypothetical protein BWX66_02135 [Deltaproteobacteria bacterium ADurb.Bin058]
MVQSASVIKGLAFKMVFAKIPWAVRVKGSYVKAAASVLWRMIIAPSVIVAPAIILTVPNVCMAKVRRQTHRVLELPAAVMVLA